MLIVIVSVRYMYITGHRGSNLRCHFEIKNQQIQPQGLAIYEVNHTSSCEIVCITEANTLLKSQFKLHFSITFFVLHI